MSTPTPPRPTSTLRTVLKVLLILGGIALGAVLLLVVGALVFLQLT